MRFPSTARRLAALSAVALVHWIALDAIVKSTVHTKVVVNDRGMLTVFIQPRILDSLKSLPEPDLSRITFAAPDPLAAVNVEQPSVDSVVNRNNGARAAAPTLRDPNSTDIAPYIK